LNKEVSLLLERSFISRDIIQDENKAAFGRAQLVPIGIQTILIN